MANLSLRKIPAWLWVLVALLIIAFGMYRWVVGSYNTLVSLDGKVQNEWSQVEVQYQRRADLIPQLVETVQGAADFESSTLTDVTEARTNWLNSASDPSATIEGQMGAMNSFDSALSRLLVTVESYPTLTATSTFETLQSQLEGTENRVAVARQDYNDTATAYNIEIKKFPMLFFAGFFGFENYPLFESDSGTENAPTVDFDFGDEE